MLLVTEITKDSKRQRVALTPTASNVRTGLYERELNSWTYPGVRRSKIFTIYPRGIRFKFTHTHSYSEDTSWVLFICEKEGK